MSQVCWRFLLVLIAPAILSTFCLYYYPAVLGCFPPSKHLTDDGTPAPFRLLVLADPQLEGDTSLPDPNAPYFPSIDALFAENRTYSDHGLLSSLSNTTMQLLTSDVPKLLAATRKRIDLLGNDYYLAHIYRTLHWWSQPTHVTVLGDLLGSQWIDDDEFIRRGRRYWDRVFENSIRVEDEIMEEVASQEVLGADPSWAQRIINIAGNHDIGYAGDFSEARLDRFESMFGKANWDVTFTLSASPSPREGNGSAASSASNEGSSESSAAPAIRLIVLNTMNLDGPAISPELQSQTYSHINDHFIATSRPVEDRSTFTILLTHIPLYKPAGVCVDAPFFSYWPSEDEAGEVDKGTVIHVDERNDAINDIPDEEAALDLAASAVSTAIPKEEAASDIVASEATADTLQDETANIVPRDDNATLSIDDDAFLDHTQHGPTIADTAEEATASLTTQSPSPLSRPKYANLLPGGLREQNHLSTQSSRNILEGIFGMSGHPDAINGGRGRNGIILTGHDHEGCDVVHYLDDASDSRDDVDTDGVQREWRAKRTEVSSPVSSNSAGSPTLREITLRSMMGAYSGSGGLLTAWYVPEQGEWTYSFSTCALGVQHWWWAVHIVDVVVVCVGIVAVVLTVVEEMMARTRTARKPAKEGGKVKEL